jgi:4-aminobutyrate aminotransferase-like enzyme
MALQPNMQILNQAALTMTGELAKFSNIPAIAEGNAILNAINDLGERVDQLGERVDQRLDQLATRIRAA